MDPLYIARTAHEADRTLAALNGDMTVGGWLNLEAWERTSLVAGVKHAIAIPHASAECLHAAWRRDKIDAGWTHGPRHDRSAKTDPLLLPWPTLSTLQRRREALFVAVVRALSAPLENDHG